MKRFFKRIIRKIGYRFIRILMPCLVIFSLVFACGIVASADTSTYNFPFSAPQIVENSGYIEVLSADSNGNASVVVLGWRIYSNDSNYNSYVDVRISSNEVAFNPVVIGSNVGVFVSYRLLSDGNQNQYAEIITDNFVSSYSFENVIGFKIYGNYRQIQSSIGYSDFVVSYGGNVSINIQLDKIIEILGGSGTTIGGNPLPNDDAINNFGFASSELETKEQTLITDSGTVIKNFTGNFGAIANVPSPDTFAGLNVISYFMNNFIERTAFDTIFRMSLYIGIFGMLAGLSGAIYSAIKNNKK